LEENQLKILSDISKTKSTVLFSDPENYQSELNNFVNTQIRKNDSIYIKEIEQQFD